MPLVQHLLELRRRLMIGALALVLATVAGWFLSTIVLGALEAPLHQIHDSTGRTAQLNFPGITSAFDVRFEIALFAGAVLSSPVWLFEIFAFLTPGMNRTEKKYIFGFFFSAIPLFLAGCTAGWLLIPHIVTLMTGFASGGSSTIVTAGDYLDFVIKLILIIGVAFVLPVFLVLLNFLGVLPGKTILHAWRWAILAITLFTALATPSADVISMFLLACPMVVLYFVAVAIAIAHDKRKAKREALALESAAEPESVDAL
jgi:sec-independent protein translocase protein TatC